jgi:8-oxo-dGTP diphosphatase
MKQTQVALIIPYYIDSTAQLWLWGQMRQDVSAELNNKWEFAGGKLEPSELPLMAALREFKEEVGLELEQSQLSSVGLFRYQYTDRLIKLYVYIHKLNHPEDYPACGFRKFDLSQNVEDQFSDLPAANVDILNKVRQYLAT